MKKVIERVESSFSDFDLFLFGSRSMLDVGVSDSDYDFAVQHSEEFRQAALREGYFESPIEDAYRDCLSVSVFSKTLSVDCKSVTVQIVTKTYYEFFVQLWNSLSKDYYVENLWKKHISPFTEKCDKKRFIRDTINQLARTQANSLLHCASFYDSLYLEEELNMTVNEIMALAQTGVEEEFDSSNYSEALQDAQSIADCGLEHAQSVYSYLGKILQEEMQ